MLDDGVAAGVELLGMADDSDSVEDGVSLADGLPEQPVAANISAAAATRNNRLNAVSWVLRKNRASICGSRVQDSEERGHRPGEP